MKELEMLKKKPSTYEQYEIIINGDIEEDINGIQFSVGQIDNV